MKNLTGNENIYFCRGSEVFGPYTVDQSRQLIAGGELLETDLACIEGESDWHPLQDLFAPAVVSEAFSNPGPAIEMTQPPKKSLFQKRGVVVAALIIVLAAGSAFWVLLDKSPSSASATLPASSAKQDEAPVVGTLIADWDFGKARKDGTSIIISGGSDPLRALVGENADWAEIVDDPGAPKKRAVRFLGTPTQGLKSTGSFAINRGDHVRIELDFKPSSLNQTQATIFRLGNSFELRLSPKKGELSFLVWDNYKNYFDLTAPVSVDAWNKVVAEYKDGVLELTINGQTSRRSLPEGKSLDGWRSQSLATSSYGTKIFIGSIGRIRWTTESTPAVVTEAEKANSTTKIKTPPKTDAPTPAQSKTPLSGGAEGLDGRNDQAIRITVADRDVTVIRRGAGPVGVIFFGHSGSKQRHFDVLRGLRNPLPAVGRDSRFAPQSPSSK